MTEYVERLPGPRLAPFVRTVWLQRTGDEPYVQRHLPTGGVELHFPIGGRPRLLGPLTAARLEVIPARTTLVGVRFRPGAAPPLPVPLDELVDQHVDLADDRLAEAVATAGPPERALETLEARLPVEVVDPLVGAAVRLLMPWRPVDIDTLAGHLALSPSQLRRRCLRAVGVAPKVLQRTPTAAPKSRRSSRAGSRSNSSTSPTAKRFSRSVRVTRSATSSTSRAASRVTIRSSSSAATRRACSTRSTRRGRGVSAGSRSRAAWACTSAVPRFPGTKAWTCRPLPCRT